MSFQVRVKGSNKVHKRIENGGLKTDFTLFLIHESLKIFTISDIYSAVDIFDSYESPGSFVSLLSDLDMDRVNFALETLTTNIVTQVFLTMHFRHTSYYTSLNLIREFSSELHFFHEFVKKYIIDNSKRSTYDNRKYRILYRGSLPYINWNNVPPTSLMSYIKKSINNSIYVSPEIEKKMYHIKFEKPMSNLLYFNPQDVKVIENGQIELPVKYFDLNSAKYESTVFLVDVDKGILKYLPKPPVLVTEYVQMLSHLFTYCCHISI